MATEPELRKAMVALLEGMRPSWVGERLGVSRQTVDAWRRGHNVTAERVAEVARLRAEPLAVHGVIAEQQERYDPEPPRWVGALTRQMLRNEAMLLTLQRRLGISDDKWHAAIDVVVSDRELERIARAHLERAPSAVDEGPDGTDDTRTPPADGPAARPRRRSRQ